MMKNDAFAKNNFKIFLKKFNIQNLKEVSTSRPAPSVCKWNKIINFVLSAKLGKEPIFSLQIVSLRFTEKV